MLTKQPTIGNRVAEVNIAEQTLLKGERRTISIARERRQARTSSEIKNESESETERTIAHALRCT